MHGATIGASQSRFVRIMRNGKYFVVGSDGWHWAGRSGRSEGAFIITI